VTTAGGVEEDLIKCMAPTYIGDFHLPGGDLRDRGINRIGNLLVPNDNYCRFEDWLMPILDKMVAEQKQQVIVITFTLHRMPEMQTIVTNDHSACLSVSQSVCLSRGSTRLIRAKTVELFEILFGVNVLGGPRDILQP